MNTFYSILTNAGIQKEILSKQNGTPIKLVKMVVGDGDITPTQEMKSLGNEKYRFSINSILQDTNNPNYLIVEGVIPSEIGGFNISEMGIYLDDDTFYAVGNLPKTYKPFLEEGSAKDLTIKMIIEVSNTDNIILKVDDTVVLATKNFVKNEFAKYNLKYIGSYLIDNIVKENTLVCFGGEFKRADYPLLFDYAVKNNLIKDEVSWQTENAKNGMCGFYSFGDGTTTFRIPNLDEAILKFSSTRGAGSYQGDAIRNITGNTRVGLQTIANEFGYENNVAFSQSCIMMLNTFSYGVAGSHSTSYLTFNASRQVPTAEENRVKSIAVLPLVIAK